MLRTFCAVSLAATLIFSGTAEGQDLSCPAQHVCVDYGNTAIAIDPKQGPVQALVTKEQTVITKTFDGSTESRKANLAIYISNGDSYDLAEEKLVDQDGLFADAALGDVYVLTKVSDAD